MDFRAALLEQTRAFGDLIRSGDPSTPVPTCGEWTLKHLFRHVGRGNRWAAQIIAERRNQPLDPRDVRDGRPPEDLDASIEWLNAGAQLIIDAVDRVGSDRVWTFTGPRPAGWWIRRRVHEVAVHRLDAALALGREVELPTDLAADGLSEWIELATVDKSRAPALELGQSVHLHATEEQLGPTGEWTILHDDEGVSWSHSHGKGSVALRGPVNGLLLATVRRKAAADAGLEVFGDETVWDGWLERTPF
ncbi:maleylpyruvate isomerase family mycothiol-dependent enzyme [Mycobacterium sp. 236(2023)]|uniref:maleylpyruvate isomerase family mycothiol-dependent enzyme n=1 Tax=Mycobacterium sp. 236(2023) TaxID=3038163 RepID=UPI002414F4A4|nr:maleylpyruvate isomerase family mycothiol-dependent enzyme [Mycobacterium sp. 236(2023)]MDG4663247.1 maleylpyruvate isomerase family mycothiol-dependent enzyme [Mycobacterium sp. 236(2023)]